MASLSNINGLFDVHSTGAILFSTSHGTSGQILRSNGNAAPTWVAASTVIGGPYLPLTGGTLSGPLSGTSATFSGTINLSSTLTVVGVTTLANVGYLGDGLGSVQYTLQSANNGFGTIDFGDVADSNIGRLSYSHVDNSFLIRTNNATALTLDSSQNATFAGTIISGSTDSIRKSVNNSNINISGGNVTNAGANYALFGGTHATLANVHRWRSGAGEVMRIDSSGNVGIGTTSPYDSSWGSGSKQLAIEGTIYGVLNLRNTAQTTRYSVGAGGGTLYLAYDDVAGAHRIIVNSSGNVGIGTTSPSTGKLVIQGDNFVITNSGQARGGIDLRTDANPGAGLYTGGISFGGASTGRAAISGVQGTSADGDRQGLAFFTHGSGTGSADAAEAMRIQSDGNVGIGTVTPSSKLSVFGTQAAIDFQRGTGDSKWEFSSDAARFYIAEMSTGTRDYIMTLEETTGNVGINTTSPTEKLHVEGRIRLGSTPVICSHDNIGIDIDQNNNSGSSYFRVTRDGELTELFRVQENGRVGIGITNPQDKLHVNGDAIISSNKYGDYASGSLSTTGVVVATITGSGNGASASIEFVGMGGVNGIVDVVYNCTNQGGNWYAYKNERQSPFGIDVVATGNGTTTLTFTFKAVNSSQGYTPRVRMIGSPYNLITF